MYIPTSLKRIASGFSLAVLSVAFVPRILAAHSGGEVVGRVSAADNSPIVGAFISVDDAAPVAQSDAEGRFRIGGIPVGSHVVRVRRAGYVESQNTVAEYTHPSGFSLAPSVEWIPQSYFLDSQNTVKNDGWTNLSLRADWTTPYLMTLFAAGQNLANRRFSQSVQVDNAAGQYFEPADGRSFYAGLRWSPR